MEEENKQLNKRERRAFAKEEKRKARETAARASMIKKVLIWIVIIGALGYGGYRAWTWINTPTETVDTSEILQISDSDHVKGNSDASITLIEYGDFQCPACASVFPSVKAISEDEEVKNNVRIVYRHLPLVSIHKHAMQTAKAAEAAGIQGKFWEMHDLLFERQEEWSKQGNIDEILVSYATELELNIDQFMADLESTKIQQEIDNDIFAANRLRINSTPTFFLNGSKIQIPTGFDQLKQLVLGS